MKVVIMNGDQRIVRYGVGDFQVNDDETVTLFYPSRITRATDAPEEETIEGKLKSGVDSRGDDDAVYRAEDIEFEGRKADDIKDYRVGTECNLAH